MPSPELTAEAEEVVRDSTLEVLETMFFAMVDEEQEPCKETGGGDIRAQVQFEGTWLGRTEVTLSRTSSDAISRDFLGLDFDEEVDEQQRVLVMGELANMICGRALSRLEPDGTFDLHAPQPLPASKPGEAPARAVHVELPLGAGRIDVRLITT